MTERYIADHDQVLLLFEKAILVIGQFEGDRFDPRFILIGGAAREVDATRFLLHDKEQIERCQATPYPDLHRREVD